MVPYQEAPSPPMTPELARACRRAIHVLRADGAVLRAGRAAVYVLEVLGYRRTAWCLRRRPVIWAVELGYWIVARNRRLFSRVAFKRE